MRRENDITGVIEPTFSTEDESFGEVQTIDLKPDGRNIEVTNDNKKEYIEYAFHEDSLNHRHSTFANFYIGSSLNGEFRNE